MVTLKFIRPMKLFCILLDQRGANAQQEDRAVQGGIKCCHNFVDLGVSKIVPAFMYCVFHHISGHLSRQILFWKMLMKTWDWVRSGLQQINRDLCF